MEVNNQYSGFGIIRDMANKSQSGDVAELNSKANAVYRMLDSNHIDNQELSTNLEEMKDIFLKCTQETSSDLSLEEKINLKYAFRDVLDEVNLKMHDTANKENLRRENHMESYLLRDNQTPGIISKLAVTALSIADVAYKIMNYGYESVIKETESKDEGLVIETPLPEKEGPIKEEDVIKNIQNIFVSMDRDKRFERYESKLIENYKNLTKSDTISESVATFKNIFGVEKNAQDISKMAMKNEQIMLNERSIQIKNTMENAHVNKTENLEVVRYPLDIDVERDVYNIFNEFKENTLKKTLEPYTPEKLFEGKGFEEILISVINDQTLKISKVLNILVSALGESSVKDIRKRLADNLNLLTEDYNLARVSSHTLLTIQKLMTVLNKLDVNASKDDFIKQLGLTDEQGNVLTYEQFTKMAHSESISKLCDLCCLEQRPKEEDSITSSVKNAYTSIGNSVLSKSTAGIVEKFFNAEDLHTIVSQIPIIKQQDVKMLFLPDHQLDKINKHMDVVVLFLANELLSEMANIASEARSAAHADLSSDVSGIDDGRAADEVKRALNGFLGELRSLALSPPTTLNLFSYFGTVASHMTFTLPAYALYEKAINNQGGSGLLDIATPLYTNFIKKWTDWASK